ncbi:alpha/beta fold hydrolase [Shewanella sp. A3A]|nr:alpha/beta fold hydrolase [Shewanella ferrihydritica]
MNCSPDDCRFDSAPNADTLLIFAHGAGADMSHPFMQAITELLVAQGFAVLRFNFPYMQKRAEDGKRRPPDRAPKLLARFSEVLQQVCDENAYQRVFLLGKSMGSRMATMLAADPLPEVVKGVICLGYPFLPKGKTAPRLEAIEQCLLPILIVQGERDSFGTKTQLQQWPLPTNITVEFLPDGDHSFEPRKRADVSLAQNYHHAVTAITAFVRSHP